MDLILWHTQLIVHTDRKNVTDFLYLVLHLARKVTCYFWLISSVLVSVLRTSINVLSKSKSRNYVTWIANLTKLFLPVTSTGLHGRLKSYNIGLFTVCFIHYFPCIFTLISPMLVTILMIGLNPMLDVVA